MVTTSVEDSISLTNDVTYYATYSSSVNYTYYDTEWKETSAYRNSYITDSNELVTVLANSSTSTTSIAASSGITGANLIGYSTTTDSTTVNSTEINDIANSNASILTEIYQMTISYEKRSNISSIGKTSDSCEFTTPATSCSVTLPSITAETGYNAEGWENSNGTIVGEPGETTELTTSGQTYYATTSAAMYLLTYDCKTNGGSTSNSTVSVSNGAGVDLTKTCDKSGWTFVGWNTTSNATDAINTYTMGSSAKTLYAIYRKEAITYTATTKRNISSATGTDTYATCTIPAVYNNNTQETSCETDAPDNPYTLTDWTFNGWVDVANTTTTTTTETNGIAPNTKLTLTGNTNLVATWIKPAITYTATFVQGENIESIGVTSLNCTIDPVYNGAEQDTSCTITLPSITPTEGYESSDWYPDGITTTEADMSPGATYYLNDNITLYATGIVKEYTITYDLNNGTAGTNAPTSGTYGSVINISNPTRTGYTFEGWTFNGNTNIAKYGTSSTSVTTSWSSTDTKVTAEYFKNLTDTNGATVTLTANWRQNIYAIYNSGGTLTGYADSLPSAVSSVDSGGTIKALINRTSTDSEEESSATIDKDNITLDLNGKTITMLSPLEIAADKTVTITDTSNTTGTITTSSNFTYEESSVDNALIYSNGNLTILKGNIISTKEDAYAIINNGTMYLWTDNENLTTTSTYDVNVQGVGTAIRNNQMLYVYGANITSTQNNGIANPSGIVDIGYANVTASANAGIATDGLSAVTIQMGANINAKYGVYSSSAEVNGTTYSPLIEVNNGEITGSTYGIQLNAGTLTISDGSISDGILVNSGSVNVSGGRIIGALAHGILVSSGTLNISGSSAIVSGIYYGIYVTGGSIDVSNGSVTGGESGIYAGAGSINVSGGTIESSKDEALYNDGGSVTISGGSFSAGNHRSVINESGTTTVTGGTYNTGSRDGTECTATSTDCYAFSSGGGEFNIKGNVTVNDTRYIAYVGGGTMNYGSSSSTISNTSNYRGVNVGGGIFNYLGGTLTATNTAIYATNGTLTVTGGTIISTGSNPTIYVTGTLILGTNNTTVLTTPLVICKKGYAVYNGGTWNYYDGVLYGDYNPSYNGTAPSSVVSDYNVETIDATTDEQEDYGVLYKTYLAKLITINYYTNDGSGSVFATQYKSTGKSINLISDIPTHQSSGYLFKGWSTSSSATTATYAPGELYSSNPSSLNLYAVWGNQTSVSTYVTNLYNSDTATSLTSSAGGQSVSLVSSKGLMKDEWNNIRYYGANPNNYISFNSELWRIVGVFSVVNSSGSTETRVKLIRNDSVDSKVWYSTNNSWAASTVRTYLNETYYSASLTTAAKSMISQAIQYIGITQAAPSNLNDKNLYTYERETTSYYSGRSATSLDYVGLMYASDYANATDLSVCTSKVYWYTQTDAKIANCVDNDWLYTGSAQWTMTANYGYTNYALAIAAEGNVVGAYTTASKTIRPTVYLNTDTYVYGGSGTSTDPYIIQDKYTINYDANGGTNAPSSQEKSYEVDIYLRTSEPTKENYEFIGWSTSSDATEVTYQPGDAYTLNSDLTLYAVWRANKYLVKLYDEATKTELTSGSSEPITQVSSLGLMQDSYGNIRYYGLSPNNYVTFNGETAGWRIIGVFDTEDENGNVEPRLKLIRNESIGSYKYDTATSGYSSFLNSTSVGQTFLNSTASGGYLNTATTNALSSDAQAMISKAKFYLGGIDPTSSMTFSTFHPDELYDDERGTASNGSSNASEWDTYVGLMYPSDYGYASDLSICTIPVYYYYQDSEHYINTDYTSVNKKCAGTNWLFNGTISTYGIASGGSTQNTISIHTGYARSIVYITSTGYAAVNGDNAIPTRTTRPVVFLDVSVDISSGSGTETDPYILS